MGSKSYNLNGSKYGALDQTELEAAQRNIEVSQELANTSQPVPPKPAIRQRLNLQAKNNPPASDITDTQTVTPVEYLNQTYLPQQDTSNPYDKSTKSDQDFDITRIEPEINCSKRALTLPLPTQPACERPYPKKVLFIVANEFCERFSYYGLRTVLVLYFRTVLGLSDSTSTVSFHLFATLCYLTPTLGAILGDSIWGKYKTILYLSIVYLLGEVTLVASSVFWNEGILSTSATFFGLLLIGLGTGGIKPCVSALGGDQFHPHEEKWRQNFFSLFYGAINLGSLISMFVTPMLRSDFSCVNRADCYPYAFGLPTVLMLLSIIVFLMAKNHYVVAPLPEKNIVIAFCHCTFLALKRKLTGYREPSTPTIKDRGPPSESTSSSSLSVSDNDDALVRQSARNKSNLEVEIIAGPRKASQKQPIAQHWLYLASDQYYPDSIEDFRSVWNILLLFAPTPIYWCLFDQQGSLWTLQATRMDGRMFNTGFVLQPDQISVANPVLLLASIPVFQVFIYPCLSRCNLLTKPIQRMTAGGILAALTFVLSALIELRIQQFMPMERPQLGYANLQIVNGLSDCYVVNPMISYVQIPGAEATGTLGNQSDIMSQLNKFDTLTNLTDLEPLSSFSSSLISADQHQLNSYKFKFKLSNGIATSSNQTSVNSNIAQCSLNPQLDHEFNIGALPNQSMRLLYLQQGNGKLTYKLFNNSLALPPPGTARVQLLYDSFGSSAQAEKRTFYLARMSSDGKLIRADSPHLNFQTSQHDGQIFLSKFLDVPVTGKGEALTLRSNDNLVSSTTKQQVITLEQGTRNLIIVHQKDATSVEIRHQVLQDNKYRISLLYQLGPYLLISVSEVMFSITGLEFSYAMAPSNMKSVILGVWSLMTALGNILTVAIESAHPFANLAHDFLFYAAIMAIDMLIFAYIGWHYKPYRAQAQ